MRLVKTEQEIVEWGGKQASTNATSLMLFNDSDNTKSVFKSIFYGRRDEQR